MKHIRTPYIIYCMIPVEQYERLIDLQIKLIKEALERKQNKCNSALHYNHSSYLICTEAQEMFITELKRQGYRFVDNDNYIEWDDIFDNEKRKE